VSHGEVEDYVVMRNPDTGAPKGFGFVVYRTLDVAQKVLASNGNLSIGDR